MRQSALYLSGCFKRMYALFGYDISDVQTFNEADKLRHVLKCYLAEYLPDNNEEERAIINAITQLV